MKNLFYTSPKYLQNLKGIKSSASEIDVNVLKSKKNAIKIAFLGDSITAEANSTLGYRNRGYAIWTMELLKWDFENVGIFGYPGYNTLQVYGQIQNVIDSGAEICVVLTGTNDMGQTTPLDTVKTHYDSIINTLNDNKIIPVFLSIFPNNSQTLANNMRGVEFNNYLKIQQSLGKIFFINTREYIATSDSTIQANKTYDGVHTSSLGACSIAVPVSNFLKNMFPTSNDYFDKSLNLFSNPYFTGTNGAIGNNASGIAPTGIYVSAPTGSSVSSSIENRSAIISTPSLKLVVNGVNTTDSLTAILSLDYIVGDAGNYILEADIQVSGVGFLNSSLRIQSFQSPEIFRTDSKAAVGGEAVISISSTLSYKMRTKSKSIQAGQKLNLYLDILNGVGTNTYYLSNVKFIKVS